MYANVVSNNIFRNLQEFVAQFDFTEVRTPPVAL